MHFFGDEKRLEESTGNGSQARRNAAKTRYRLTTEGRVATFCINSSYP